MRHRYAAVALVGAVIGLGGVTAPAAEATGADYTLSASKAYSWVGGYWDVHAGSNVTKLHITLPAELSKGLTGAKWTWSDTNTSGAVPDGVTSFDVAVPHAVLSAAAGDFGTMLDIDNFDNDAGPADQVDFGITLSTSKTAGATVTPVDLALKNAIEGSGTMLDEYTADGSPTVTEGTTVSVVARPGFFTHGPEGTWTTTDKPGLQHYYTRGDCTLACLSYHDDYGSATVSADGSTMSFKAPAYDSTIDPTSEFMSVEFHGDSSTHRGVDFDFPLKVAKAPPIVRKTDAKISGTAQVGHALSVGTGTWSPTPTSYTYQWYRGTKAITGATRSTYTAVAADLGAKLKVKVTARRSGYTSGVYTTPATSAVKIGSAPKATTRPSVSGTKTAGHTLTASHGTWTPKPSSYSYRWYRAGKAISGATHSTYKLTAADRHQKLYVKITATLPGYTAGTATSATVTIG
ncbi:hypothetical protein [Streptomyces sp. NPDC002516]